MTSAAAASQLIRTEPPRLVDRLGDRIRQFVCGLHGHDALLHFEKDRVSLVCTSCSYESPGWQVGRTAR